MDINENIPMDDLCVDLDTLGSNNQNGNEMFDIYKKILNGQKCFFQYMSTNVTSRQDQT